MGGPDSEDNFKDDRKDYIHNEVALDYNAAFQGLMVGMLHKELIKKPIDVYSNIKKPIVSIPFYFQPFHSFLERSSVSKHFLVVEKQFPIHYFFKFNFAYSFFDDVKKNFHFFLPLLNTK